jgi:IS30 family transposase
MAKTLGRKSQNCVQYCSVQCGTNESTKELVRQYFPKGTDFTKVSQRGLRRVVGEKNDRLKNGWGIENQQRFSGGNA